MRTLIMASFMLLWSMPNRQPVTNYQTQTREKPTRRFKGQIKRKKNRQGNARKLSFFLPFFFLLAATPTTASAKPPPGQSDPRAGKWHPGLLKPGSEFRLRPP